MTESAVERIKEYREKNAVNQSLLKAILNKGRYALTSMEDRESTALSEGSLMDDLLLLPEEDINQVYYFGNFSATENQMKVIKAYEEKGELTEDMLNEELKTFYPNWKPETRLNKAREIIEEKFDEYLESKGKMKISNERYDAIMGVINTFETSPLYREVFKDTSYVFTQVPIYFKYKGISSKALIDILKLYYDEEKRLSKVVIIDMKTVEDSVKRLPNSFSRYRYDFQAAFYTKAVEDLIKEEILTPDFKIEYKILAISRTLEGNFALIDIPKQFIKTGWEGGMLGDRKVKGVDEAYDHYIYYMNTENTFFKDLEDKQYKLTLLPDLNLNI